MNYGISYQGNKSAIAKDIIALLPKGKRLVDLFGGGGAMTHCAILSHKWESVLYNDINPLPVRLFKRAVNGEFNYNRFKPKWVSREEFEENKNKDGYIKYIWSFGNNGRDYLFGRDMENYKRDLHNAVVFDDFSGDTFDKYPFLKNIKGDTITDRRLNLRTLIRDNIGNNEHLQQLEQLERLQQLERLEQLQQLQQLERLEYSTISYLDYQYKDGDVVYCDIPYENTGDYGSKFDHKTFYDWAKTRNYPVWFSSYDISDDYFKVVLEIKRRSTFWRANNNCYRIEKVYHNKIGNGNFASKQMRLF